LKQARQTVESLQLAELDNFFRDACADAKPTSIEEIDPTAAVIYPIILSDRLEVILSIPGKPLRRYTTVKPQAELETAFRVAKNVIRPAAFPRDRRPPVEQVYDWLIRPAEADLTATETAEQSQVKSAHGCPLGSASRLLGFARGEGGS
jgi:CHAT domain-containing protein